MSKNIYKGQREELIYSLKVHNQSGVPLLISPLLLRELGAGQIDLAILERKGDWRIILYEIKSSGFIDHLQHKRLKKAAHLLSKVFECSVSIHLVGPEELGIAKDKKLN